MVITLVAVDLLTEISLDHCSWPATYPSVEPLEPHACLKETYQFLAIDALREIAMLLRHYYLDGMPLERREGF